MWFFNSKTNYLSSWFCLNSWSQTNNYNSLRLSPYPSNPLCRPSDPTPSKSDRSADITGTTESHRLRPGIPYGRRWGLRKWDGILGLQMISLVFFFSLQFGPKGLLRNPSSFAFGTTIQTVITITTVMTKYDICFQTETTHWLLGDAGRGVD